MRQCIEEIYEVLTEGEKIYLSLDFDFFIPGISPVPERQKQAVRLLMIIYAF
jgi:hypothetical protein